MGMGGYGGGMGYGTPGGGMGGMIGGGGGRRLNYNPDSGGYWGNTGGQYGGVPYGATDPRGTSVNPYGGIPGKQDPNAPIPYQGPMRLYEQRAETPAGAPSSPGGMPAPAPGPVAYGGPMRLTNQMHQPAPNFAPVPQQPQPGTMDGMGGFQPPPTSQRFAAFGGVPQNFEKPGVAQQPQAPPGYYYASNGSLLLGSAPDQNKTPNVYGGGQPGQFGSPDYVPGSGWQQMLDLYAQQRQANMGQQAQFGRYADGTPISDPSINFRANDRRPRYGGGWDF